MIPKETEMPESAPSEGGMSGGMPAAPRQTLAMRLAERNRQRTLRAERLAKLRAAGPDTTAPADLSADRPADLSAPEAAEPEGAMEVSMEPAVLPVVEAAAEAGAEAGTEPPADPVVASGAGPAAILPVPAPARDLDADAALADFLRALTGGVPAPAPQPAVPGAILPFHRPADRPEPASGFASGLDQLPGAGPGLVWALGRAGLDSLAAIAPLAPEELADRLGPIGRLVPAERWVATARAAVTAPAMPAP